MTVDGREGDQGHRSQSRFDEARARILRSEADVLAKFLDHAKGCTGWTNGERSFRISRGDATLTFEEFNRSIQIAQMMITVRRVRLLQRLRDLERQTDWNDSDSVWRYWKHVFETRLRVGLGSFFMSLVARHHPPRNPEGEE